MAPPPDVALPAPPVGFVPLNPKEFQGFRPKATQMTAVPTAVAELNGSTTYGADFGVWAPAASDIATSLDLAYRWRLIRAAVDSFATYARTMDGLAWRKALTLLKQLEPNFDAAVAHNPALVNAYPGLERVFGAPKVIAQAATATKKKAAKVKAQAAATTAVNTATSTTPPATPATQAAPAATAGRTVTTVTG